MYSYLYEKGFSYLSEKAAGADPNGKQYNDKAVNKKPLHEQNSVKWKMSRNCHIAFFINIKG